MVSKKYSSYAQIDQDLKILALEKEIYYEKLMQSAKETKESLSPGNLLGEVPKLALNAIGGLAGPIKSMALSFLAKKFLK